jgi:phenylpyruvate tautomerase PptA (4-oxalocrotonate tautomerase family)
MPIVEIEVVGERDEGAHGDLAARLASAVADVLGSRPRGTWIKLRYLDPSCYAENGDDGAARPVFVSIIKRANPVGDVLRDEVARLTRAVADTCGRPVETVHVLYRAPAAGRLAFGGTLVD